MFVRDSNTAPGPSRCLRTFKYILQLFKSPEPTRPQIYPSPFPYSSFCIAEGITRANLLAWLPNACLGFAHGQHYGSLTARGSGRIQGMLPFPAPASGSSASATLAAATSPLWPHLLWSHLLYRSTVVPAPVGWSQTFQFSSFQSLSRVRLFATPWITAHQASLSITNSRNLLKLMPIKSVMPSSHLILCHPLLLPPPIPPSIRVFSNESTLRMRWPKYWSFSLSISPSNEHPGLISFRMDWLNVLAVQGTLRSLLQHHSSKASLDTIKYYFLLN